MIGPSRHRLDWVQDLHRGLRGHEQNYLKWPREIASRAKAQMDVKLTGSVRTILTKYGDE